MLNYFKIILRGVGQVMLQNNALTGLLFLTGIFYNSWLLGIGAAIGNIISTPAASILKYPKEDIKDGLYGFNGTLVGIAIWFLFGFSIATTLAIIIGAILSTFVMHEINKKIPAFTAPFVISTWVLILGIKFLNFGSYLTAVPIQAHAFNLTSAVFMGIGQVMFQANIITGLIFLLAILVNSRTAAIYALYGTVLGGLFALLLSLPLTTVNLGIFGYNAVLCGIALGGKKWNVFFLVTFAILLSVVINLGMAKTGIITLTAPFVLATWTVLLVKHKLNLNYIQN